MPCARSIGPTGASCSGSASRHARRAGPARSSSRRSSPAPGRAPSTTTRTRAQRRGPGLPGSAASTIIDLAGAFRCGQHYTLHEPSGQRAGGRIDGAAIARLQQVATALQRLGAEHRQLVQFAHLQGLTIREFAARSDLPVGPVRRAGPGSTLRALRLIARGIRDSDELFPHLRRPAPRCWAALCLRRLGPTRPEASARAPAQLKPARPSTHALAPLPQAARPRRARSSHPTARWGRIEKSYLARFARGPRPRRRHPPSGSTAPSCRGSARQARAGDRRRARRGHHHVRRHRGARQRSQATAASRGCVRAAWRPGRPRRRATA